MRDYIEIKKDLVPYNFQILLAGGWFEIGVDYNKTGDFFTIALYKDDELVAVEPLVLNSTLFQDVYQPEKFPAITLVPYDASENEKVVTHANLGETVFLTIDDEEEVVRAVTIKAKTAILGTAKLGEMILGKEDG